MSPAACQRQNTPICDEVIVPHRPHTNHLTCWGAVYGALLFCPGNFNLQGEQCIRGRSKIGEADEA